MNPGFLSTLRALAPAVLAAAACALATPALAQQGGNVPPPPPMPQMQAVPDQPSTEPPDPDLEPQVTIIQKDQDVIEEVRGTGGQLRFVRVTPAHGRPYYLIPDAGPNTFIRRDSLDSGLRVPMWVLWSW